MKLNGLIGATDYLSHRLRDVKEVTLFLKGKIKPVTIRTEDLAFEIERDSDTKEYQLCIQREYLGCGEYGSPEPIDTNWEILFDATPEFILDTAIKRSKQTKFRDGVIAYTDNKYLSEDQIKIKKTFFENLKTNPRGEPILTNFITKNPNPPSPLAIFGAGIFKEISHQIRPETDSDTDNTYRSGFKK